MAGTKKAEPAIPRLGVGARKTVTVHAAKTPPWRGGNEGLETQKPLNVPLQDGSGKTHPVLPPARK
jgi:hypothetical protein